MADTKVLTALGTMIEDYVLNIFVENGVTGEEAAMVTEIVAARFLKQAYRDTIMAMVQKPDEAEREKRTGPGTTECAMEISESQEGKDSDEEKLNMLKEFAETANARERKTEGSDEGGGDECRHTE